MALYNFTYGWAYVYHIFINDISRYIATFGDLKKRTRSSFLFQCFFFVGVTTQTILALKSGAC